MLWISVILILILVGTDQLIKYWAVASLQEQGSIPFLHIGDFEIMRLTYLENTGAAFSSFSGMRWLLIGATSLLMIVCAIVMVKIRKQSKLACCSLALVLAGGIGNLIDRLFRNGCVIDYLDLQLFDFAVFNFADCCVVVGVILFAFYILFFDSKKEKTAKATQEGAAE